RVCGTSGGNVTVRATSRSTKTQQPSTKHDTSAPVYTALRYPGSGVALRTGLPGAPNGGTPGTPPGLPQSDNGPRPTTVMRSSKGGSTSSCTADHCTLHVAQVRERAPTCT